jgi:hypothetical protein
MGVKAVKQLQFFSPVQNGHISDNCRHAIAQALRTLSGKEVKVTIEERKKKRSLSQNAYYWSVVIPAVTNAINEHGNSMTGEQVHEFLKAEVGGLHQTVTMPTGEIKSVVGSSTVLTTMQFENYMEQVRVWAAEMLQIVIPLPNEM